MKNTSATALPNLEDLLQHRSWLERLARQLVLDDAQVDDLVQETWLAAMQAGAQPVGDARAWLGGVARNLVRGRLRREAAVRATECDAARPEAGAAEGARLALLQHDLTGHGLALDEPGAYKHGFQSDSQGRFKVQALLGGQTRIVPGTYRFELRPGGRAALLVVDGLGFEVGESLRDAHLEHLDLVLQRGVPVELHLASPVPGRRQLDGAIFGLRLESRPSVTLALPESLITAGHGTLHFPEPGRYRLVRRSPSTSAGGEVSSATGAEAVAVELEETVESIEVLDSDEVQHVELNLQAASKP